MKGDSQRKSGQKSNQAQELRSQLLFDKDILEVQTINMLFWWCKLTVKVLTFAIYCYE